MNIADTLTPVEKKLEQRKWIKVMTLLAIAAAVAAYVWNNCL